MENFVMHNPVKLHFGSNILDGLGKAALSYGKKALLVYGKGSVMTNGAYKACTGVLKAAGISCWEYSGIKSNPVIGDVDRAAALGREYQVDMVIALGGGSVIDSAKLISVTIPADHSGWAFMDGSRKPSASIPLIAILTLAATGTEMNPYAVLQDDSLKKKIGYGHRLMYPRHSFLDPGFTVSVPADYTAYGIADLVAHSLEAWFGEGEASLSDRFVIAIIREAMEYGPLLMKDLFSRDLRARVMYAATCALNGMTTPGRKSQDWGVHGIGHCLSVLWDIPHGASLSIAYPAWLALQSDRIPDRIAELGRELFSTETPGECIWELKKFFTSLGCPVSLPELQIHPTEKDKKEFVRVMVGNKVDGLAHRLSKGDLDAIAGHIWNA
jgi:alcohol dehydrogenase YqhD (iron-dependent ADH family)